MEYKKIRFLILSKTNEIERMLDDLFIEHQEQISLNCKTYQNIRNHDVKEYDFIIIDNSELDDSIEMIRQIRHQMNQNIPILMCINQEFMQKLNDCIEAGISDYIVKPYTKEMLKLRIQNNLNLIDAFKMSKNKELQFDALLNNTPYMAWFKDKESHYITVNREFREHSGKDDETIHGRDDQFVWDGQIGDRCREFDLIVMNERRQIMFDEIIPGKKRYRQFNIYKMGNNDFIIHNTKKEFSEGHTHITNFKTAKYLINLAIHKSFPERTLSNRLIDSIIRISTDNAYINNLKLLKV